jgi:hypothetical protein
VIAAQRSGKVPAPIKLTVNSSSSHNFVLNERVTNITIAKIQIATEDILMDDFTKAFTFGRAQSIDLATVVSTLPGCEFIEP